MGNSDRAVLHLTELLIKHTDEGLHLTEIDSDGVVISGTYVPKREWVAARRQLKNKYNLASCSRKEYIDLITALTIVLETH